jgi:4-hydroxy-tetrahydrodipicolinate synthase
MELYWQVGPARRAGEAVMGPGMQGTGVINRTVWKYMDWLAGFNGGPLKPPTSRISDGQMAQLRAGLKTAGLPVTDSPDSEFLIGRNPE